MTIHQPLLTIIQTHRQETCTGQWSLSNEGHSQVFWKIGKIDSGFADGSIDVHSHWPNWADFSRKYPLSNQAGDSPLSTLAQFVQPGIVTRRLEQPLWTRPNTHPVYESQLVSKLQATSDIQAQNSIQRTGRLPTSSMIKT